MLHIREKWLTWICVKFIWISGNFYAWKRSKILKKSLMFMWISYELMWFSCNLYAKYMNLFYHFKFGFCFIFFDFHTKRDFITWKLAYLLFPQLQLCSPPLFYILIQKYRSLKNWRRLHYASYFSPCGRNLSLMIELVPLVDGHPCN